MTSDNPYNDLEAILGPLSNPVRQQLLVMLAGGPITYTKLLDRLQLESGSFYWHIGKMRSLVDQTEDKQYQLSDLGRKAYELLTYNGPTKQSPFRPGWYRKWHRLVRSLYSMPNWVLAQQVLLLLLLSVWLFASVDMLQIGTLPLVSSVPWWEVLVSVILSVGCVTTCLAVMFYLYIRPDRDFMTKSRYSLLIRLLLSSMTILLPGVCLSLLYLGGLDTLANQAAVQFLLSLLSLLLTILLTTSMVDHYLDLGLKDGFLIVLPPYYILVLVSFFVTI